MSVRADLLLNRMTVDDKAIQIGTAISPTPRLRALTDGSRSHLLLLYDNILL